MTIRLGINGLGRIGRCVLRAVHELNRTDIEVVAVNGPATVETHAHLLTYDSVHGTYPGKVEVRGAALDMGRGKIPVYHERDPKDIPWKAMGADIVLECTGKFNSKEAASVHLESGAKKVLVSAPAKHADATIVYGGE